MEAVGMEGDDWIIGIDLARGPDWTIVDGKIIVNPYWQELRD